MGIPFYYLPGRSKNKMATLSLVIRYPDRDSFYFFTKRSQISIILIYLYIYIYVYIYTVFYRSWDSAVSIATGYVMEDRGIGVRVPVVSRIFSSPYRPDRFWGPPNLLPNGYRGFFRREKSGRGVKLTTHLQLVRRSRKLGSIHPLTRTPSWRRA
jgi:hypothetical protein